ncbi:MULTISPECIES: chemotaxis protein CheD [Oxalobacteraceae]|jgi:chemotaxis protein CheD|uniref:chemotaxis protein CheD n=1 Tax=Oxalobacteraceae TaxID=75682 RepID=UPI0010A4337C|nr:MULTISPECIES: chemotaxis protein CheD [Oxalobacteraceae]
MKAPEHATEIYLQPGEVRFGDRHTRIRTLLGSCVSLTVWHPRLLIGGMCHYMLPTRSGEARGEVLNGCYGDEAVDLLLREIRAVGTRPDEYQVKMFGGGNMFPGMNRSRNCGDVPFNNVGAGRALVRRYGFRLAGEHLGGTGHRTIIFDIWSGDVWLKHRQTQETNLCENCDRRAICAAG